MHSLRGTHSLTEWVSDWLRHFWFLTLKSDPTDLWPLTRCLFWQFLPNFDNSWQFVTFLKIFHNFDHFNYFKFLAISTIFDNLNIFDNLEKLTILISMTFFPAIFTICEYFWEFLKLLDNFDNHDFFGDNVDKFWSFGQL